jgi:hypothetical protein
MDKIRATYQIFPRRTAPFWTWLTGCPAPGETARGAPGPFGFFAWSLVSYLGGLAIALAAGAARGGAAVAGTLLGWCLVVHGARRLVSTVAHQCIHSRFSGRRGVDHFVGELVTLLTFTQTAEEYRKEHFVMHHARGVFTTPADPAAQFLHNVGFRPGRDSRALWRQLVLNIGSPWFHGYFFWGRLRSNLIAARPVRKLCAWLHVLAWATAIAVGAVTVKTFVLAVAVPVVCLYQLSVLFEFISEHAWFVPYSASSRARAIHGTHSWGRFCGSAVPQRAAAHGSRLRWCGQWLAWVAAHLFYHLPVRILVLPGDLPQHDFHHRRPNTRQWTQATHARQSDLEWVAASESDEAPYLHFWGLHLAISHVLDGIARAAPRPAMDPACLSPGILDGEDGQRSASRPST